LTHSRTRDARVHARAGTRALHRSNLTHVYTGFISPPKNVVRRSEKVGY